MEKKEKIEYNWYEILGLEFYPIAEENEEIIKNKIEEKKKEWISKRNDKEEYKIYFNLYEKEIIQKQMLGENNIRKKLIKKARDNYFEPIDKFLNDLKDIPLTEEIVQKISKETKKSENIIKERIIEIGRVLETKKTFKSLAISAYKKYCGYTEKKKSDFSEFSIINDKYLKYLNKKDLYSFLISEVLNIETLTMNEIKEKRNNLKKNDTETSYKKKLYDHCEKLINNKQYRQNYDDYLKYLKYKKIKEILERKKKSYSFVDDTIKISKTQIEESINEIEEILKNKEESTRIFIGFCIINKIPYEILDIEKNQNDTNKNTNSKETKNYTQENTQNQNTENEMFKNFSNNFCDKAFEAMDKDRFDEAQEHLDKARDYWMKNPRIVTLQNRLKEIFKNLSNNFCNKAFEAINNFKLDEAQKYLNKAQIHWENNPVITTLQNELDKAKNKMENDKNLSNNFCDKASTAIDNFRFNKAQKYLNEAKVHWENNPKIEIIKNRLHHIMNDIETEVSGINYYTILYSNYEKAKKAYENLKVKYPGYSNADLEKKIENIKNISQHNDNAVDINTIIIFAVLLLIIGIFIASYYFSNY